MRTFTAIAAAGLLFATSTTVSLAQGGDLDCGDFGSWEEAQGFYESQGPGDPHRLDADNDGIACETLR